jgi:hypothetical protein
LPGGLLYREQSIVCLCADHAPNVRPPEAHQGRTVRTALSRVPAPAPFGNGVLRGRLTGCRTAPFQQVER